MPGDADWSRGLRRNDIVDFIELKAEVRKYEIKI